MMKKAVLGLLLGLVWQVQADTVYVDMNCTNSVAPYATWETSATNIQDAVDIAEIGNVIRVNDGHYLLTSEIRVNKDIVIQSVNGPNVTVVDGNNAVRCFNLGSNACVISGFIVTNGREPSSEGYYAGGIYCADETPVQW